MSSGAARRGSVKAAGLSGSVKEAGLSGTEWALRYFSYCLVHTVQRPLCTGVKPVLDEPTIFACSHVGLMDPVILMIEYFDRMVHPLVAMDYFEKNSFTRAFYRTAKCIPIERRRASTQWLEESLAALGKGEHIIIYPEGKRNKTGRGLLPFHSGAALLAAHSGARIVPVYNCFWTFPHRYRLYIGEPFRLPPPPEGDLAAWLKEQTAFIQSKVAALIPEDAR